MGLQAFLRGLLEARVYRSQYEMADAFNSKQPTVNHWLQGVRFPGRVSCVKISRATGKPLGEIVEMVDEDTRSEVNCSVGISQCLEQVLREQYSGRQKAMAQGWGVKESTLSRWLHRRRIPDSAWYDFLANGLSTSVEEVHRLCQEERRERMPRRTQQAAVV